MRVHDVHHAYRNRRVLRGLNLRIGPGTLAGIVGENGAGKSTLLKILAGQLRPDRGSVEPGGKLGYCPQHVVLNDALTVAQHVRYFQSAYRLPTAQRAWEVMEELGLIGYAGVPVDRLSGGTRQKLNLTLAVMHDPAVLLLDEPYQGFDWDTYQQFWALTARLRDEGRCVLIVSHLAYDSDHLDVLWRLSDGVLEREGSVVAP